MSLTKVPCAGCQEMITLDDYAYECRVCGAAICSRCWNDEDHGGLFGVHYHEAIERERQGTTGANTATKYVLKILDGEAVMVTACVDLRGYDTDAFTTDREIVLDFDAAWEYLGGTINDEDRPSGLHAKVYLYEGVEIFEGPSVW